VVLRPVCQHKRFSPCYCHSGDSHGVLECSQRVQLIPPCFINKDTDFVQLGYLPKFTQLDTKFTLPLVFITIWFQELKRKKNL
jgi:hypothetical protein